MVREIRNPNGFFSGATGSARLQPDGGVVINWGALPGTIFSEYDADDELLFELHMPGLNSSYRTVKEPLAAFDIAELRRRVPVSAGSPTRSCVPASLHAMRAHSARARS